MKLPFKLLLSIAVTASLAACSDDDAPSSQSSFNPYDKTDDSTSAVKFTTISDNAADFHGIIIDSDNNLTRAEQHYAWYFTPVGTINDINEITRIPKTGWVTKTEIAAGNGYVAWSSVYNRYCRIFVDEITGGAAKIQYQEPFIGSDETIDFDNRNIEFDAIAASTTLLCNSPEYLTPFSIEISEKDTVWCKVGKPENPAAGQIIIKVRQNKDMDGEGRSCPVKLVTAYGQTTVLNVTQLGPLVAYIRFSEPEVTVGYHMFSNIRVNFTSNVAGPYSASVDDMGKEWCTATVWASESESSVIINCQDNTGSSERKAEITVTNGNTSGKLTIIQKAQ